MARPRTPIGTFGDIDFTTLGPERVRARTRVRDFDGQVRRVEATGATRKLPEHRLKEKLTVRATHTGGTRQLTPESSFTELVEVWLADLDLEGGLAPSTRALYERNLRQLVMPAFEHYTLREVTIGRIEPFLKSLAANKSYSYAKQAKTVLNLALGLAARYEAIPKNPVREAKRMKKPPSEAVSLTPHQIEAIRSGARAWRRGPGVSGPPPDGQLEQIIEVMLGTSARIGEVLAIRKCDVDVTRTPTTVLVCGTIVFPKGKPTTRQSHPKTASSTRLVSVPSFTAAVLRERLVVVAEQPGDHLLFFSRNHTPLTTNTFVDGCGACCRRSESPESRRTRSVARSPP
jgi:integrase